ncbi:MAG: hypothetical protein QOI59_4431 [Gammaproteobacteria bacterium]|nr:hypothetical protein [Gammaproteobacteria bacterium]
MSARVIMFVAVAALAAATANAGTGCNPQATPEYPYCLRLVDSLRPEKPGQMRVFAADGSEFNAGQAQWMKAQLRKVELLCARDTDSDRAQAARLLAGVEELLRSHQHRS